MDTAHDTPTASGAARRAAAHAGERGASLVEYALLIALIAVVMIGAVTLLGDTAGDSLDGSSSSLMDVTG
jgi:pilus assembly protein Flp/PilA